MKPFLCVRAGYTARYWETSYGNVQVEKAIYKGGMLMGNYVSIQTGISAAGGGVTRVNVLMRPEGFKQMIQAMHEVDREALIGAFSSVMHEGIEAKKASAAAAAALAA